jgi:hypothetical protein
LVIWDLICSMIVGLFVEMVSTVFYLHKLQTAIGWPGTASDKRQFNISIANT